MATTAAAAELGGWDKPISLKVVFSLLFLSMAKASVTTQQREILREEKGFFPSRHARYTLRVLQSHDGGEEWR